MRDQFQLLTIPEVCGILHASRPTVTKLIDQGSLPCVRIGGRVFVLTSDLERYIARPKVRTA